MMRGGSQTGQPGDGITGFSQLSALCPRVDVRITSNRWQQMVVVDDEAIWWACPECGGWHVLMLGHVENEEKKL